MKPYSTPPSSHVFASVYATLLSALSRPEGDRDERKRCLDLLLTALSLWRDPHTEAMERELGMLLLDHVHDAWLVTELAPVLHRYATPASVRILREALRRAFDGDHGASLLALVYELSAAMDRSDALPHPWVERAVELSAATRNHTRTAFVAAAYVRTYPERGAGSLAS